MAGKGCIFFFGVIWTAMVGLFDWTIFPGLAQQWTASTHFVKTRATVLEAQVQEVKSSKSVSYKPQLRYQYLVKGVTLMGERYRFGMTSSNYRTANHLVESHPPGSQLDIWYAPDEPSLSVIDNQLSGTDLFLPMFMTPFHVVALALLLGPFLPQGKGPGGIPVLKEGLGWRAKTYYANPLFAALGSLGCLTFSAVFLVGFGTGMQPGLTTMVATWSILLGLSVYAGVSTHNSNRRGDRDLIIDPGSVRYTPLGLNTQPQSRPLSEVDSVEVVTTEKPGSNRTRNYNSEVQLKLKSGESHTLRVWSQAGPAEEFAQWLRSVMAN